MKQHLRNTHFFKQWHVHVTVTNILNRINLLLILVACSLLALFMLHLYDSIILFFSVHVGLYIHNEHGCREFMCAVLRGALILFVSLYLNIAEIRVLVS